MEPRVELPGSHRAVLPDAVDVGPPDKPLIQATIVLSPVAGERQQVVARSLVEDFAIDNGLDVLSDTATAVRVQGRAEDMAKAFGTTLRLVDHPRLGRFRVRTGPLSVPAEVAPHVRAVMGLDDRPVARPHLRLHPYYADAGVGPFQKSPMASSSTFAPPALAAIYGFPTATGKGVRAAVIELGGAYKQADQSAALKGYGLGPVAAVPLVVTVDGAKPKSDGASGADAEVMLDTQVLQSVAPGLAALEVVFGPNTTDGFYDAIEEAGDSGARVVSISWGGPEESWTAAAMDAYEALFASLKAKGVIVTAASGDNGSNDGYGGAKSHADFPASAPSVIGCGGTTISVNAGVVSGEVVWYGDGAGGGGVSSHFGVPAYQKALGVIQQADTKKSGRVVPDLAANADPRTGYQVRVDGGTYVIGGTSAVAPLIAALFARLIELDADVAGLDAHVALYDNAASFYDVTVGSNGAYKAQKGFDACTGLGTPTAALCAALIDAPDPPVDPPPVVTPPPATGLDPALVSTAIDLYAKNLKGAVDDMTAALKQALGL